MVFSISYDVRVANSRLGCKKHTLFAMQNGHTVSMTNTAQNHTPYLYTSEYPPPRSGHSARQYRKIQQFVLGILVTFDGSCVSSPRIIASFFLSIRNQCSKLGIF